MRLLRDRTPDGVRVEGLGVVVWWRSREGFWRGWRLWPIWEAVSDDGE